MFFAWGSYEWKSVDKKCGGVEIEYWEDGENAKWEKDATTSIEICKSECEKYPECEGFTYDIELDRCGQLMRGIVFENSTDSECHIKAGMLFFFLCK